MAGKAELVAFCDQAKEIFSAAGDLGEKFATTKRFQLHGGPHCETVGYDDYGRPVTATYVRRDTVESSSDLIGKFANKFTELGLTEPTVRCAKAPLCIHEHAVRTLFRALLGMIEEIDEPPGSLTDIAKELRHLVQVVRLILQRVQSGWAFADYREFSASLNSVSQAGLTLVAEIDPFAFVDDPAGNEISHDNSATLASNRSITVQLVTPLTDNDRHLLVTMAELHARKHKPETASLIIKSDLYRGDEKRAFRNLKTNRLVDSKPGKSGGYWLTEFGEKMAQKLSSN